MPYPGFGPRVSRTPDRGRTNQLRHENNPLRGRLIRDKRVSLGHSRNEVFVGWVPSGEPTPPRRYGPLHVSLPRVPCCPRDGRCWPRFYRPRRGKQTNFASSCPPPPVDILKLALPCIIDGLWRSREEGACHSTAGLHARINTHVNAIACVVWLLSGCTRNYGTPMKHGDIAVTPCSRSRELYRVARFRVETPAGWNTNTQMRFCEGSRRLTNYHASRQPWQSVFDSPGCRVVVPESLLCVKNVVGAAGMDFRFSRDVVVFFAIDFQLSPLVPLAEQPVAKFLPRAPHIWSRRPFGHRAENLAGDFRNNLAGLKPAESQASGTADPRPGCLRAIQLPAQEGKPTAERGVGAGIRPLHSLDWKLKTWPPMIKVVHDKGRVATTSFPRRGRGIINVAAVAEKGGGALLRWLKKGEGHPDGKAQYYHVTHETIYHVHSFRQVRNIPSGAGMKRRGKREIIEKTRRPTASTGTITICENPVTWPGIEPGSPWWETGVGWRRMGSSRLVRRIFNLAEFIYYLSWVFVSNMRCRTSCKSSLTTESSQQN
ncbi:hypothetical protein PR048_003038 [Dryococelus australis]|uniref:Uncharacterized protein n=1 Tax=Dryococelus australis TaxID=614101 RepID=A0ABQ9ILX1_9NEOP|nr:hypothetical protein PR048_003038 [Dryococelus australis]